MAVSSPAVEKMGYRSNFELFDGGIAFRRTAEHTFSLVISDPANGIGDVIDLSGFENLKNTKEVVLFKVLNKDIKGRLKTFAIDSSNQNQIATATMVIEEDLSGDNVSSLDGYYADFVKFPSQGAFVESISDQISVSRGESSADFSHQINVKFRAIKPNGPENPLVKQAKAFADGIFASTNIVKLLSDKFETEEHISDITGTGTNFKTFFSETYNTITNECSFSQTLSAENVRSAGSNYYSHTATQSVSIASNGIVTMSEEGKIKGLLVNRLGSAEAGYITELAAAKNRLKELFNAYKNPECTEIVDVNFLSTTKTTDKFSGEITYSLKADNDPKNADLDTANPIRTEKSRNYSFDNGIWTATESGTITSLKTQSYDGSKNDEKYPKLEAAYAEYKNVISFSSIRNSLQDIIDAAGCKDDLSPFPTSRTLTMGFFKGVVQYEVSFSTDKRFAKNNTIKSLTVNGSTDYETIKKNEFLVPKAPVLIQESAYKTSGKKAGSKQTSVKILGYRRNPTAYGSTFNYLLGQAKTLMNEIPDEGGENYIESASASCTPVNNVTFDLSVTKSRGMDGVQ